jgi:hypothetical protein
MFEYICTNESNYIKGTTATTSHSARDIMSCHVTEYMPSYMLCNVTDDVNVLDSNDTI